MPEHRLDFDTTSDFLPAHETHVVPAAAPGSKPALDKFVEFRPPPEYRREFEDAKPFTAIPQQALDKPAVQAAARGYRQEPQRPAYPTARDVKRDALPTPVVPAPEAKQAPDSPAPPKAEPTTRPVVVAPEIVAPVVVAPVVAPPAADVVPQPHAATPATEAPPAAAAPVTTADFSLLDEVDEYIVAAPPPDEEPAHDIVASPAPAEMALDAPPAAPDADNINTSPDAPPREAKARALSVEPASMEGDLLHKHALAAPPVEAATNEAAPLALQPAPPSTTKPSAPPTQVAPPDATGVPMPPAEATPHDLWPSAPPVTLPAAMLAELETENDPIDPPPAGEPAPVLESDNDHELVDSESGVIEVGHATPLTAAEEAGFVESRFVENRAAKKAARAKAARSRRSKTEPDGAPSASSSGPVQAPAEVLVAAPLERAASDEQTGASDAGQTAEPAADSAAVAEPRLDEPGFVKQGRRRQRAGRAMRVLMSLGSLALAGALLAQGMTTYRNQVAAQVPQLKPLLVQACGLIGCVVDLPAQIDTLSIEQGELQTLAENKFSFVTVLRNQSGSAQVWPHLELTLTDSNEKAVLRRVFAPADYVSGPAEQAKGFAARTESTVKLNFELAQLKASGYHIAIFYP